MPNERFTKEELLEVVLRSRSFRDVIVNLGMSPHGGSVDYYKKKNIKLEINTSHFTGKAWNKDQSNKKRTHEDILLNKGRKEHAYMLRRSLKEIGIREECMVCKITEYNNRPINLEIDHIDGDNTNNVQENLRFICPNCHSQTSTYKFYGKKHSNKTTYN
mgnify:FL=1